MSDLDSFFAKKDRKKKKASRKAAPATAAAAAATTIATTTTSGSSTSTVGPAPALAATTDVETSPVVAPAPVPPKDDGWIDFDDPKSAQVNTGGRVVAQFKRGSGEETATGNEGGDGLPTEKFSGWTLNDEVDETKEPSTPTQAPVESPKEESRNVFRPRQWLPPGPDVNSSAQFPSLADAAKSNAPEVPHRFASATVAQSSPTSRATSTTTTTTTTSSSGRPRFYNSKLAARK